jgi:hypothetical protein
MIGSFFNPILAVTPLLASYRVQYENGTLIEEGTIPNGGSVVVDVPNIIPCANATYELRDSAGVLIESGSIVSGGSATITAPDGVVNVNKSDGVLISSEVVKSNDTKGFNVADSLIENSDGSYTVNLKATEGLILPDVDIEILDQSNNVLDTDTIPSVKNHIIDVYQYCPPAIFDVDLVDRFGNAFPTKQVTANATWDLRTLTPYDFADIFLSQMDTTPTTAEEDYIEYIVDQYVAAGLWNKMYLIRPYVGSSANNNALNLRYPFKNRSSQFAVFVGSPIHDGNGITHTGNSYELAYLDGSVLEDLNWHMNLYSRLDTDPNAAGATDMGFSNNLNYAMMEIKSTAIRALIRGQNTNSLINPPPTSDGSFTLNCLSGFNNTKFFKNGSTLLRAFTSTTIPTGNLRALCIGTATEDNSINYIGAARFTNRNFAMATVGEGLTDTEIADKYTIDQAAQTIMLRQV